MDAPNDTRIRRPLHRLQRELEAATTRLAGLQREILQRAALSAAALIYLPMAIARAGEHVGLWGSPRPLAQVLLPVALVAVLCVLLFHTARRERPHARKNDGLLPPLLVINALGILAMWTSDPVAGAVAVFWIVANYLLLPRPTARMLGALWGIGMLGAWILDSAETAGWIRLAGIGLASTALAEAVSAALGATARSLAAASAELAPLCLDTLRQESARGESVRSAEPPVQEPRTVVDPAAAGMAATETTDHAAKVRGEFLTNVSHEIRTPMNSILGMSMLALRTDLDPRQRDYISKVQRAAESLLGIINDLLDFSRIETGRLTIEAAAFTLGDVLEHVAEVLGVRAREKRIELLFDIGKDIPLHLRGDPARLQQVLLHLIGNAIKFTESGQVVVRVALLERQEDAVRLRFTIRDSGIGMSEAQQSRIFGQSGAPGLPDLPRDGGSGLGLALSRQLIALMGGTIGVQSEPGAGSTFRVELRFGVASPGAELTPSRVADTASDQSLIGLRALVVDDNEEALEVSVVLAMQLGLQVLSAADGHSALQVIEDADERGEPIDVVLMDWRMPDIDGIACAGRIRRMPLSRQPAIVMVTSHAAEDSLAAARREGIQLQGHLSKPLIPSGFRAALVRAIADSSPPGTATPDPVSLRQALEKRLAGRRILVVEDNDFNQQVAMELLSDAGMRVEVAENGKVALDRLAVDDAFDAVLMDCMMPVMDGYAATRAIRARPELHGLPIIAMTANSLPRDRQRSLDAGMDDHLPKPVDPTLLLATLLKWIEHRESARER